MRIKFLGGILFVIGLGIAIFIVIYTYLARSVLNPAFDNTENYHFVKEIQSPQMVVYTLYDKIHDEEYIVVYSSSTSVWQEPAISVTRRIKNK